MGRPKVGEGAQVISLSVERNLIRAVDELARASGTSRAAVFARGAKALLQTATAKARGAANVQKRPPTRRRLAG
jgi:hypothetical protein